MDSVGETPAQLTVKGGDFAWNSIGNDGPTFSYNGLQQEEIAV